MADILTFILSDRKLIEICSKLCQTLFPWCGQTVGTLPLKPTSPSVSHCLTASYSHTVVLLSQNKLPQKCFSTTLCPNQVYFSRGTPMTSWKKAVFLLTKPKILCLLRVWIFDIGVVLTNSWVWKVLTVIIILMYSSCNHLPWVCTRASSYSSWRR